MQKKSNKRVYDLCYTHYSNIQIEAKNKKQAIKMFNELKEEWEDNNNGTYELDFMGYYNKDGNIKPLNYKKGKK